MGDEIKVKCGNCGRVTEQHEVDNEISFGSCDLDTRPAPPVRYLIGDEIQICPHCGYVHWNLSEKIRGSKDVVVSDEFIEIGKKGYPDAAANYLKIAYLVKDEEDKFYNYLSAAWVFDDKGEYDNSVMARNLAIEISKKVKNQTTDFKLIVVDLYRRTKQFKEASKCCDEIGDDISYTFKQMVKFQRKLIKKKNYQVYNMKEALEED